jgi:hypothetical protein
MQLIIRQGPNLYETSCILRTGLTFLTQGTTPITEGPTSRTIGPKFVTDYSKHYGVIQQQNSRLQLPSEPPTPVAGRRNDDDSNDNDEEQQVIASLQVTPVQDQHMEVSSSDQQTSLESEESAQSRSPDGVDGSARFCSVKGCKAVIPGKQSYLILCYRILT